MLMKKRHLLCMLLPLIFCSVLPAQVVYLNKGVNAWATISPYQGFESLSIATQQTSEFGLHQSVSKKIAAYIGLSDDTYMYHLQSDRKLSNNKPLSELLYQTKYLGVNLGIDGLAYQKKQWELHAIAQFSIKKLNSGERTRKQNFEENSSISTTSNLLIDTKFPQSRWDFSLGVSVHRRLSDICSFYTRYLFNKSFKTKENAQESYGFSFHSFSLGLEFDVKSLGSLLKNVNQIVYKKDLAQLTKAQPVQKVEEEEVVFLKDSALIKIYFPPKQFQFYPSHINMLEEFAQFLLDNPTVIYKITGYHDGLSGEENAVQRVQSVLTFCRSKGVPNEQFMIEYSEVYDEYSMATNVWNRRVELMKMN